ncbi:oxygen-independent coproporphyrinogen III oxidase [Daejeonella lutea]|uniref:Coproporphyrinogen-III oxidase n=1 Tax=Daejeonella lutea TaxID=572036 RepID=A0A1T5A551_9SPHI|nr:oxygen-independent coproporphyrinogen III oxidase [Daejeonella lutea]SKB30076.1 oxygen-independent coproporphyrinogen-3 oxidase [Daejeonella lutea]
MKSSDLTKKYNVAAPRYTSYPTVPYWDVENWDQGKWFSSVRQSYNESSEDGISVYIHLPFCENLCTYCGCTTRITKNHAVEGPYIDAVLKEWQMYYRVLGGKPRIREIHLGGGTPTFFSPANLQRLMDGIRSNAIILPEAEFSFEGHPTNTTPEHLKSLYDCGFRRISLGIQDFDPLVQEIINRRQTVEQVRDVTLAARKLGYKSVNYDLIYGLPLQKLSSVENTTAEVIKLKPDRIAYYSYAHVPWLKPGQRRFTESDLPAGDEKRALYESGRDLLLHSGYCDIGMDHFALKNDSLLAAARAGRLHRNFMGYTHQYTKLSIGLGVSSISDSWYAFAQNVKTVETYLKNIAENTFPLVKGHILNQDDLVIRRIILDIMCRGQAILPPGNPQEFEFRERLESLEQDGLVEISSNQLRVTPAGMAFLRNICMCFDQKLWSNAPDSQIFSTAV